MTAQIDQIEAHRRALTGHCYRMLGSVVDADDAAQETVIRAWRSLDRFDGRASLRTWLYRIATNVCLDELQDRGRRARPMEEGPGSFTGDLPSGGLAQLPHSHWIEPIPDVRALPADANPAERAILRQSIPFAFVAALQRLAPRQRAVLLLRDVLGWSADEAAETLEMSVAAANSALQRARQTLAERNVSPSATELSEPQRRLLNRYVDAFERYDIDELAALLRQDATLSMPPYALWMQGSAAVRAWMLGPGAGCRGSRLLPIDGGSCGSPAFAQYRPDPQGGHAPWALLVLEFDGDRIAGVNSFLDTATLFPKFDLSMRL